MFPLETRDSEVCFWSVVAIHAHTIPGPPQRALDFEHVLSYRRGALQPEMPD